jgi:hypothetical protein
MSLYLLAALKRALTVLEALRLPGGVAAVAFRGGGDALLGGA